ncbi:MAG TPA: tetratricopeptide repeat protein [Terriglobia bacterium]|jgi:tetratricopeptide (TPR) repeat protein
MSRSDSYLKTYVDSGDGARLQGEIAEVWKSIRSRNVYSGGPRSEQTQQAIARSIVALKLASRTNDRALLAEACRLMAHTLNVDEQYGQSLDHYRKAITLFESCGSPEQANRTRLGFMAALYMTGNYDEAMEAAGEAERWFQSRNNSLGLAKIYTNVGNINYRREQHREALRFHSKARGLFEQLKNWPAVAMSYLNIANGLSFTDQLDEAEAMYNSAEELSARFNMQELFMQTRYNKSYLMFLQGRYPESIESFGAVREYFMKMGSQHHVNLCDLDGAEIHLHLLQPKEAVIFASRAVDGFAKLSMRYEHAKALTFLAMGLAQLDQIAEAEAAAVSARTMFEAEANTYWISVVDFCLAYVRMAKGDVDKARLLAAQAKLQFKTLEIKGGMAESLMRLGSMTFEPAQMKTAAACMTEVLKLTINKRR